MALSRLRIGFSGCDDLVYRAIASASRHYQESYINDYPAMAEYIRAGRLSGEISPKVEASLVLASTPPGLVETVGVPKVCIVGFSCIADSTREYNSFVKTMEQIPSSPLLPYEPAANFAFGSLCEPLKAIYPAGWYWVTTGHILSHASSNMDWWGVRDAFLQTPPGLTNTLTVIGCCINDNNTNDETIRDGAYGPVPFAGVIVGTFSVYQDEVDRPALLRYQAATNACTEPHVQKYNVLEHALNAETFIKVFPGATGVKLRALRTKLDPSGVFFDPTRARPW